MSNLPPGPLPDAPTVGDREALAHLRRALLDGDHWYLALLEAVALWVSAEEVYRGQRYRYLVANEAFDWLRLAERLCDDVMDLLPQDEAERLLCSGQPPLDLEQEEFRARIGGAKYRAHLNFFYGVTVEQALVLAVEEELRKEAFCGSLPGARRGVEDPYERIYGMPQEHLLARFRAEQGELADPAQGMSLDEWHAFTYWLFKYRLTWCDKARVASDTKKGLAKLQQLRRHHRPPQPAPEDPILVYA